jgi:hypothetical protein
LRQLAVDVILPVMKTGYIIGSFLIIAVIGGLCVHYSEHSILGYKGLDANPARIILYYSKINLTKRLQMIEYHTLIVHLGEQSDREIRFKGLCTEASGTIRYQG